MVHHPLRPLLAISMVGAAVLPPALANNGKGNGQSLCIDDRCVDGNTDITLTFQLDEVDFRAQAFRAGMELQVNGSKPACLDSPCSGPRVFVRASTSGQLLAASFDGVPTWMRTAEGVSTAPLDPVQLQVVADEGLCTPYDAGCGDGTVYERATVDLSSANDDSDESGRFVSRTGGWGPGGYHVSMGSLTVGNYSCEAPYNGRTSIIRDACDTDSDCPAADVARTCEDATNPTDHVYATLSGFPGGTGDYEAFCEVLSTTSSADRSTWQVALDCVFTLELRIGVDED